jgi:hypothetical protein
MKIEDTPVAKDEAEDSEQAVNALVRVLEDLERHPDVAVYHGIGLEFQGHFFEIDPQGWEFVVNEHGPQRTGRQISEDAFEERRRSAAR